MITNEVDVLVIAATDGTTLSNALENAAAGAKVVAYDPLTRNCANVDCYATFDHFKAAGQQVRSRVNGLRERLGNSKFNVELIGDAPDDINAYYILRRCHERTATTD